MDELNTDPHDDDFGAAGADDSDADRLTPRVAPAARRRRKNPFAFAAVALIVVALGVVVMNGLGDATRFYRHVDEAIDQRDTLGDRRFRIQGLVDGDSIVSTERGVDFVITHDGLRATIAHIGDPPDLFQAGIPVILEGRWARVGDLDVAAPVDGVPTDDGWFFASDRALIQHTEVYVEDHPDRFDDYDYDYDGSGSNGYDSYTGDQGETEASPAR